MNHLAKVAQLSNRYFVLRHGESQANEKSTRQFCLRYKKHFLMRQQLFIPPTLPEPERQQKLRDTSLTQTR